MTDERSVTGPWVDWWLEAWFGTTAAWLEMWPWPR
jgi:hypothetical protein